MFVFISLLLPFVSFFFPFSFLDILRFSSTNKQEGTRQETEATTQDPMPNTLNYLLSGTIERAYMYVYFLHGLIYLEPLLNELSKLFYIQNDRARVSTSTYFYPHGLILFWTVYNDVTVMRLWRIFDKLSNWSSISQLPRPINL